MGPTSVQAMVDWGVTQWISWEKNELPQITLAIFLRYTILRFNPLVNKGVLSVKLDMMLEMAGI